MLLPSALPCDSRPALRCAIQFPISPPITPPTQSHYPTGITASCRALHSLLGIQSPLSLQHKKPITAISTNSSLHTTSRTRKRPPPPPRGHKRSRGAYESEDEEEARRPGSAAFDQDIAQMTMAVEKHGQPSTPKRQRRAPLSIPFGLERSDFHDLYADPATSPPPGLFGLPLSANINPMTVQKDEQMSLQQQEQESGWTPTDDRMLVDLLLEKLKPSGRQWDECAREMGAEREGLETRWRWLMQEGMVGVKFGRGLGEGPKRGGRRAVRGVFD